jgi:hypothetical protein
MSANKRPTHSKLALSTTIVAIGATVLALAGCGGSSSSSSTQAAAGLTQTARHTASRSNADVGTAQAQRPSHARSGNSTDKGHKRGEPLGRPPAPAGSIGAADKVHKARPNQNPEIGENPTLKAANPCKLVSRSEAQTILGRTVSASIEAPLGPTCIYQLGGSKSEITLQVENVNYSQISHQLTKRSQVDVAAHKAYCGTLGTQMLFVPLAGGQVLHVTAPCAIAQRFATLALGRLAA